MGAGEVLTHSDFGSLLAGRTLLVSGATGIGAATTSLALEAGARVCVVSLHAADCDALRGRLHHHGGSLLAVDGDLAETSTADRAVALCVEAFGRIDMLFNVAGLSGRRFGDGPLHECTDEGFDETIRGNLRTLFLLSRAAVRQMLAQEPAPDGMRGSILQMASVMAYAPQRDYFSTHAYAAAKAGVIGLTKAMASYYAPHKIRVNAIAPGLVRTPMSQRAQQNPEILSLMQSKQPLAGDLLDAEDVARTALFLLSSAARMVTGEIVGVDGGWQVSG